MVFRPFQKSVNILILFSFLKDIFTGHRILHWQFFFSNLKVAFQCLFALNILVRDLQYYLCLFSSVCKVSFSLWPLFKCPLYYQFWGIWWRYALFSFSLCFLFLEFTWILGFVAWYFSSCLILFGYYSQIFFLFPLSHFSSPLRFPVTYILGCLGSHSSVILLPFFNSFHIG